MWRTPRGTIMSDNKNGEGQKGSANNSEQNENAETKKTPTIEEIQEQLNTLRAENESLKASKERILRESKEHASKARELRDAKEAEELEAAKKKEDYKGMLAKEAEKRQAAEKKLGTYKAKVVTKTLDLELSKLAPDAQSVDALKKLLPVDLLEIQEAEDDFQISGLKEAVDKMRTEQPYLFKSAAATKMMSSKPGVSKTEPLSLGKLNTSELARLLVNKNAQKT